MSRGTWVLGVAMVVTVCAAGAGSANAESVGLKYVLGYGWGTPIAPTDEAGVVPQINWTNALGQGQSGPTTPMTGLVNQAGVASTIDLTAWTVTQGNGWGSADASSSPAGSWMPQTRPEFRYSFQPEPAR